MLSVQTLAVGEIARVDLSMVSIQSHQLPLAFFSKQKSKMVALSGIMLLCKAITICYLQTQKNCKTGTVCYLQTQKKCKTGTVCYLQTQKKCKTGTVCYLQAQKIVKPEKVVTPIFQEIVYNTR